MEISKTLLALRLGGTFKNFTSISSFESWLEVNQWNLRREELLKSELAKFDHQPLLSIVMPLYNTPLDLLSKALNSVHKQVYLNWELCIGEDCSTNPRIRPYLENWIEKDPRIKVVFGKKKGNISRATNSAAKLAEGDFLVLIKTLYG